MDRSGLNPVKDLRLLLRYRELLAELRPAAYLGFTIKPNIYGAIAARLCGVPAIPNISGLGTVFIRGGLLGSLVSGLYRFGLAKAPVVFFQNADDLGEFVGRKLVRRDQARLLAGSGIDLEPVRAGANSVGPLKFLLIARLLGDKGVREFVDAARLLRREGVRNSCFQLLGPLDPANRTGIAGSELEGWIAEDTVEYLGVTDDVRPFIAEASAFVVLPSYREGLPRSLLEAGAMARPLIATDVPGCRAVVEDGHNGYLCAVRDPASLADAMLRLANLPAERRQAMGEAARRTGSSADSWPRTSSYPAPTLDALAEVAPLGQQPDARELTSKLER